MHDLYVHDRTGLRFTPFTSVDTLNTRCFSYHLACTSPMIFLPVATNRFGILVYTATALYLEKYRIPATTQIIPQSNVSKRSLLPGLASSAKRSTQDSNLQALSSQRFSKPLPHHPDMLQINLGDRNRICDPLIPNQVLYQTELHRESYRDYPPGTGISWRFTK